MASRKFLLNQEYDVQSLHHMITRQATLPVFASMFHMEQANIVVAPVCGAHPGQTVLYFLGPAVRNV